MTNKKEAGATPWQFYAAFKDEAVRMWLASGQAAEVTALALGISVFQLYEWRKRVSQVTRAAGAPGLPESKEAPQLEVLRLQQENLRLTEQRDTLEKPRAASPNRRRAVCPDPDDERQVSDQDAVRDARSLAQWLLRVGPRLRLPACAPGS